MPKKNTTLAPCLFMPCANHKNVALINPSQSLNDRYSIKQQSYRMQIPRKQWRRYPTS